MSARRACFVILVLLSSAACEKSGVGAYARRIASPDELIGGPHALGTTGDWLLGNQNIRIVIQDQGWSRGFGIFGGGIIDADIVRPGALGTSAGGQGRDNFGEFFPALFLQAFDVGDQDIVDHGVTTKDACVAAGGSWDAWSRCKRKVKGLVVVNDGSNGKAAVIRTYATGGDFLTMLGLVLDLAVPQSGLRFETDYILAPDARHVRIEGRLINDSLQTLEIPQPGLQTLLGLFGVSGFELPLGDVALFGAGNSVYAPGAVLRASDAASSKPIGFDLRFSVEESYKQERAASLLPGLVVDFLATAGPGVSYGYAVGDSERNYVWMHRDAFVGDPSAKVTPHSMLVPFLLTSFTGAFYEVPPESLAPGDTFAYTKYFVVGDGDVAAIRDELFDIRGTAVGSFMGEVRDERTGAPAHDTWVHIFDANQTPYTQIEPDADGRFRCRLEPGIYYHVVTGPGRYPTSGGATRFGEFNRFEIGRRADGSPKQKPTYRVLHAPSPAELIVNVRDEDGRALPAKVSIVGTYTVPQTCQACAADCDYFCDPRNYLFDFSLGEERRPSDLGWREGATSGQFIDQIAYASHGLVHASVRPSLCDGDVCAPFDVIVSRGIEYDVHTERGVIFEPGKVRRIDVVLRRVVDTSNYVSADLHVHSRNSVDSIAPPEDRVLSAAAEGLELLVASDHNYVTDFAPAIAAQELQDWVASIVGIELSTLEAGHFNAFPVGLDRGVPSHFPLVDVCFDKRASKVNGTAFDWVECAPSQWFDNLRSLGEYGGDDTIVQINHPRDGILGYFNQYYLNPYTGVAETPTGDNYPFVEFIRPNNSQTGQYDADNFSYDFDAIEVFNGKRFDLLHPFVTPTSAPQEVIDEITDSVCGSGHPDNGPGKVLLENGGHISYPGGVDDWLRLLNRGYRVTATANSDSHDAEDEVGSPRTYLYVEPGSNGLRRDLYPGTIHPLDAVEAIRGHRALATNGPFLEMAVVTTIASATPPAQKTSWPVGSTVKYATSNAGNSVDVLFTLRTAPWIDVDQIRVYGNGEVIDAITVANTVKADGRAMDDELLVNRSYTFDVDTVLVAEAYGDGNLFPVVIPKEQPPTNVTLALGAILANFGGAAFGQYDGVRGPSYVQKVTPYALTNPVWLDIDADGVFDPPGNDAGPGAAPQAEPGACGAGNACPAGQTCDTAQSPAQCVCTEEQALRVRSPAALMLPDSRGGRHYHPADIRRVFAAHAH